MSETKFTQGPWLVAPEQVTGGYLVKPDGWSRGVCTVTQRDPHPLSGQGIDWDQAKANAHLIAAAPELYEELEGIYTNLAMAGGVLTLDEDDFTSIGKLLSKARGE